MECLWTLDEIFCELQTIKICFHDSSDKIILIVSNKLHVKISLKHYYELNNFELWGEIG